MGSISKSALIRELYDDGLTISEIAKQLGAHYSFVHGVVRRHEEKQQAEQPKTENKAEKIRQLHDQGKATKDIVALLQVTHSHVNNIIRRYKDEERN